VCRSAAPSDATPAGGSGGTAAAAAGDGDAAPTATTAAADPTAKAGTGRASCPVTRPPQPPFVPPTPYPATPPALYGGFWYGSNELWTLLHADGTWVMPRDEHGLSDKSFWWRAGFDPHGEPTTPHSSPWLPEGLHAERQAGRLAAGAIGADRRAGSPSGARPGLE
jgi:hypothetical protein